MPPTDWPSAWNSVYSGASLRRQSKSAGKLLRRVEVSRLQFVPAERARFVADGDAGIRIRLPDREHRGLRVDEDGHASLIADVERTGVQLAAEGLRFRGRGIGVGDGDVRHPERRHSGHVRPELVHGRAGGAVLLEDVVHPHLPHRDLADRPSEQRHVERARGGVVGRAELDPAEVSGLMGREVRHEAPPPIGGGPPARGRQSTRLDQNVYVMRV